MVLPCTAMAQPEIKECTIKKGSMHILLSKSITDAALDSFIADYNLYELNLKKLIRANATDSLVKAGWKIELNNNELLALSKKFSGAGDYKNPALPITVTDKLSEELNNFPVVSSRVKYGVNRFKNKKLFAINDSVVSFFLRGHTNARSVVLAGSFNVWSTNSLYMTPTDSGWIADVKLGAGKYWYKFIIDGQWDIDRDNRLVENDGRGNDNSVFYKPNFIFRSHRFTGNKQLYLAGSFNNWDATELPMAKTPSGWALALYLADGTHTYRFIADGQWQEDPENNDRFPNEFHEYNSVVRLGKATLFTLDGFTNAAKATLVGSFNNWRDDEVLMNKTSGGWQCNYSLGAGNFQYAFKVNDEWVTADSTQRLSTNASKAHYISLVIEPNYTFKLKGFDAAKKVFIAGDFNNWSPDTYPMMKAGDEWHIDLHLDKGKHLYKFVVDYKWILDPGNKLWEQNEHETGNSVLWIE